MEKKSDITEEDTAMETMYFLLSHQWAKRTAQSEHH